MFSRWVLIFCLFTPLVFSSCSDRVPTRSIISNEDEGSLEGFSAKIEAYFEGKLSPAEIDTLFDNICRAIDKFLQFVVGQQRGVYRPAELVEFIETYFLKDTKISPALSHEVMELKRVVLGGTNDSLTEKDLRAFQLLFRTIANEMKRLQPYMPFSPTLLNKMSIAKKDEVLAAFRQSGERFGDLFEQTVGTYKFERFENFVKELEKIFADGAGIEGLRWVRDHLYLFRVAKVFANYTSASMILKEEWKRLFSTGVRWATLSLDINYFLDKGPDIFEDHSLTALEKIMNEGFSLLEEAIRPRPFKVLTFDEFAILLDETFKGGQVTVFGFENIEVKTVLDTFRPFVQKFMGGPGGNLLPWLLSSETSKLIEDAKEKNCVLPVNQMGRCLKGLSVVSLRFLRSRFQLWIDSQRMTNLVYRELGADPKDLNPAFPKGKVLFALNSHLKDPGKSEVVAHLIEVVTPYRSFYRDRTFSFVIDPNSPDFFLTRWQVSQFSWVRTAAQLFIGGYAEGERGAKASALKVEEFQTFYREFRDFGVAINIFDPRYNDSPEKRTREANLFTSNGNGDGMMDLNEAIEEFGFLLSLKRLANGVHDEISKNCPVFGVDVMGFPKIDPVCYRNYYYAHIGNYITNFPALTKYFFALNVSKRSEFLSFLDVAARRNTDIPFEIEDSESYSAILHYLESIMYRFDMSSNGKRDALIDEDEARVLFPIIKSELIKVSPFTDDSANFAVLAYLMKYGYEPSPAQYIAWRAREVPPLKWVTPWDVFANRSRVLQVFAFFNTPTANPTAQGFSTSQGLQSFAEDQVESLLSQ